MTFRLPLYLEKFFVEDALKEIPQSESVREALRRHFGNTLVQIERVEPSGDTWNVLLGTSEEGILIGSAQFRDDGVEFLLIAGITV